MELYGDTHNFGRRVRPVGKNWILKPRSTFWEELFLSKDSGFRELLDQVLVDEPIMACFPKLEMKQHKKYPGCTLVSKVRLNEATEKDYDLEFLLEALGGLLAISGWFGFEDLHVENLFFGVEQKTGKLLLFPIDIEICLRKIEILSTMGILRRPKDIDDVAGISCMYQLLQDADPRQRLAVVYGYIQTSQKLIENQKILVKKMNSIAGIKTAPIRAVLRSTMDYEVHMGKLPRHFLMAKDRILMKEEIEQISRGDVPYFYTTLKDRQARYYVDQNLRKTSYIKNQKFAKTRTRLITPDEMFSDKKRNKLLLEYGTLMIAAYFCPKGFVGEIRFRNLHLIAKKTKIKLQFKDTILQGDRFWPMFQVTL